MSSILERFFWKGVDSLAFYDQATFVRYLGADFQVSADASLVMTLRGVTDVLPPDADRSNGREFFYLLFETDTDEPALAEGVYDFGHRELGTFQLLIAPRRVDLFAVGDLSGEGDVEPVVVSTGTNRYRAIVNRIAYSAMGSKDARLTDWPLAAARFNPDSAAGFAPAVTGDYIVEGEGIEEVEDE